MKIQFLSTKLRQSVAALLICSAPIFVGCSSDPVPQPNPGQGTTGPGSGTVTNPGSGTATNPGSGTATNPGSTTSTNPGTVVATVDYIKSKDNLTFLAAAVAQAGMAAELNKADLTVFAPSDDAFKAAGYASVAAVSAAPAASLQRILRYHVIGSRIDLSAIPGRVNTSYQTTLTDARLSVYKVTNSDVSINGAKVIQGDIPTTGSTVHIINQLLMPPTVNASEVPKTNNDLSLFTAAANQAGTSVQNFLAQNSAEGVTIFAPNNAAFKAAGYADEAAIKAADPKKLADILLYHVLKYRAYSQTFQNGSDVVTAQGGSVRFNVSQGKVTIQGKGNGSNVANIVQADQTVNNGVVHVIDRVLLPEAPK